MPRLRTKLKTAHCVRGYYVYIRTYGINGKQQSVKKLHCKREPANVRDQYAAHREWNSA